MRRWLIPLLLTLALLVPAAVQAQTSISMTEVEIDLWPEYDRSGVLVIYRVTLSPFTSLPVDLSLRIPADAGEPYAVAGRQSEGSLFNIPYTRQVSGDWANINFTADISELQIEYYDPALQITDQLRKYDYTWPGDYATDNLSMSIQQPFDASGMLISPSFGAGITGGDGLTYFNRDVGQLSAGQTIEISLQYNKASDTYSVQSLPVQPSGEIPADNSGSIQVSQSALLILAGILGAALIVGGVLWYRQSGQQTRSAVKRRRRRPAASRATQPGPTDEGGIYCHKCGKRAQAGDRFCRSCGTELRIL